VPVQCRERATLARANLRHSDHSRSSRVLQRAHSQWQMDVARAVDELRVDVPGLLKKGHKVDYSIYSPDITLEDVRLPSFKVKGIENYRSALEMLRWSLRAACDHQQIEVTSVSGPLNGVVHMRWRLLLWPKDLLLPAKDFLQWPSTGMRSPLLMHAMREPFIVEGYSRYEFDAWSGKIIRHTLDITNPPVPLMDLLTHGFASPLRGLQVAG